MQAIYFIYGRPMLEEERALAASTLVTNTKRLVGNTLPRSVLNDTMRHELERLLAPHTAMLLGETLPTMRQREGAHVIGFDGAPWVANALR